MDDFFKIVSVWDIFVIKYVKLSKVLTWFLVCDNTLSGKGPNALVTVVISQGAFLIVRLLPPCGPGFPLPSCGLHQCCSPTCVTVPSRTEVGWAFCLPCGRLSHLASGNERCR